MKSRVNKFQIILFYQIVLVIASSQVYAQLVPNLGGQRSGISAFQFLKIGVGARATALGETFVALANDATALYWNPAGLTQFSDHQLTVNHTEYVVDIKHDFIGAVYHISRYDAVGLSLTALYMEDMEVRTETQPFGTGRYFSVQDLAFALSYSRKMTDQFSFGISLRYAEEVLDVVKMRGVMVDLGTFYWTGLGNSRFAVVVSNFGSNVQPSGELRTYDGTKITSFQSFSPPTQFKIGFAMEPLQRDDQELTTSIELQHPNDNAENVRLGIEYTWNHFVFLRAGIKRTIGEPLFHAGHASAHDYSFGIGFKTELLISKVAFDYSFTNFNLLGNVHRLSLGLIF